MRGGGRRDQTAARGAAGVTPAPTVHSIQSQNAADGILLSMGVSVRMRACCQKGLAVELFRIGAICCDQMKVFARILLANARDSVRTGLNYVSIPRVSEILDGGLLNVKRLRTDFGIGWKANRSK